MSYSFSYDVVNSLEGHIEFVGHIIIDLVLYISSIIYLQVDIFHFIVKCFLLHKLIIHFLQFQVNFLEHFFLNLVVDVWEDFCLDAQG